MVYFNIRNILPKSGTFPPGHCVYNIFTHTGTCDCVITGLTKCKRRRNKWSWSNLRRHLDICLAWLHENSGDRCRSQCLNRRRSDYGGSIWAKLLGFWPILISPKPLTLPKFSSRAWFRIHVNWQKRGVEGVILVNLRGKRDSCREVWTESMFVSLVLLCWCLQRIEVCLHLKYLRKVQWFVSSAWEEILKPWPSLPIKLPTHPHCCPSQ